MVIVPAVSPLTEEHATDPESANVVPFTRLTSPVGMPQTMVRLRSTTGGGMVRGGLVTLLQPEAVAVTS